MQPQAAAPRLSLRSLVAGCAGFHAGAHHGVVRGCTRAVSGGGAAAVALLAHRGLRWLLRWRAPRCKWLHPCSLRRRSCCRHPGSLVASCAGFYAGAHHGVVRGCTRAASGGGAPAVALLARRELRWLPCWCAPRVVRGCTRAVSGGGASAATLLVLSLARRRAYGTCAALVLRLLLSFAGHWPITFNGTLNVSSALKSESSAVVGLRRSITTDRRCWNYSASMMQTQR